MANVIVLVEDQEFTLQILVGPGEKVAFAGWKGHRIGTLFQVGDQLKTLSLDGDIKPVCCTGHGLLQLQSEFVKKRLESLPCPAVDR